MNANNLPQSDKFDSSVIKILSQRKFDLLLKETLELLKRA